MLEIILLCLLLIIAIYDIKNLTISNKFIVVLLLLGFINYIFSSFEITKILGLLGGFIFFLLLYLLFPKGIGFGDVKLAGAIGLFLGFKLTILAILLSFFSGAIVGLLLIALGKKTMKDPIPFGPFLAFGAIFSIFFGEYIIDWYLKLLV